MNSRELIEALQRLQDENGAPVEVEVSVDMDDLHPSRDGSDPRRAFGKVCSIQSNGGYITLLVYDTEFNFSIS